MATFLNFQWQEVEPKYLNPLLSYLNLNSGLNLPKNCYHSYEILVQSWPCISLHPINTSASGSKFPWTKFPWTKFPWVQGNDVRTLATMEVLIIFCPFNYFALCLSKFHSQWILALSFFSRAAASLRLLYVFFSHFATICFFVTENSLFRLLRLQPTMPLVWILCNQAICFRRDLEFGCTVKFYNQFF